MVREKTVLISKHTNIWKHFDIHNSFRWISGLYRRQKFFPLLIKTIFGLLSTGCVFEVQINAAVYKHVLFFIKFNLFRGFLIPTFSPPKTESSVANVTYFRHRFMKVDNHITANPEVHNFGIDYWIRLHAVRLGPVVDRSVGGI
jgi:hypothetical protein